MSAGLKVGDRVKVEFEATVQGPLTPAHDKDGNVELAVPILALRGVHVRYFSQDCITKLAPPEPQWRVGDAVIYRTVGHIEIATLVWDGTDWRALSGASWGKTIGAAWQDGRITRLVPEVAP